MKTQKLFPGSKKDIENKLISNKASCKTLDMKNADIFLFFTEDLDNYVSILRCNFNFNCFGQNVHSNKNASLSTCCFPPLLLPSVSFLFLLVAVSLQVVDDHFNRNH